MKNGRGLAALAIASTLVAGSLVLATNYEKIKAKIENFSVSAPVAVSVKDQKFEPGVNEQEAQNTNGYWAKEMEDRKFEQVIKEQEAQRTPGELMSTMPKNGQEDFFDYDSGEPTANNDYPITGNSDDWMNDIRQNTLEGKTTNPQETGSYEITKKTGLTDKEFIDIDGNLRYKNKDNLAKYFINEEKNPDLSLAGAYPGLQEWMEQEGMHGYELRKYRFEDSSWESMGLVIFDYGKDNKKKVFDYFFSPLKDYGFILEDGKFAYFSISSAGNNPEVNKEYLTTIVNYQKEHKAKLYFSSAGKKIKISPEEYMGRLDSLVKEYSKNDYWKERGESEITEQLLK
jgi:hypothetical protein